VAFTAVISVDCALITIIRSSGLIRLIRGHQVEPVFVRHHHVSDDQIAFPVLHPAPKRRGIAGTRT